MRAFVLSCFVFLLVACSEREQYEDYINRQLFTHYTETDLEKYDFIVVIPRRGCHACIRTAESFFEGSKNNPKFLFIFTKIDSPKKLRLELGEENFVRENVKIDKDNIFYNAEFNDRNYPLLLNRTERNRFTYKRIVSF